jgi:ABC-type phosphate/phosphonate transport system substrate-binding protein
MKKIHLSYYPDITQYQTQDSIRKAVVEFSKLLSEDYSKRLNQQIEIEVLPVMNVKSQTELMQNPNENCAIGLMKPISYVLAKQQNQNVFAAGVAWREISGIENDKYIGQLFVHKNSGIKSFKDINKKHRIAYGDSFSTSNFLIQAAELYKNGIHPFTGFRISKFFGGHDGTAKAVYYNEADIGAGHDGAIILLANEKGYEDANEFLIPISKVEIYSDPVAVRIDLMPDVDEFTESLISISSNPIVQRLLQDFWGNVTRLGKADPCKYYSIEEALIALNLKAKDVL